MDKFPRIQVFSLSRPHEEVSVEVSLLMKKVRKI